jgi:hypothetical protein
MQVTAKLPERFAFVPATQHKASHGLQDHWSILCEVERAMSSRSRRSKSQYRVAVCARPDGRYTYQLFAVAAEPRTLLTDDTTFDSPEEAERAGYEILELLEHAAVVDATATSTEPPAE